MCRIIAYIMFGLWVYMGLGLGSYRVWVWLYIGWVWVIWVTIEVYEYLTVYIGCVIGTIWV